MRKMRTTELERQALIEKNGVCGYLMRKRTPTSPDRFCYRPAREPGGPCGKHTPEQIALQTAHLEGFRRRK